MRQGDAYLEIGRTTVAKEPTSPPHCRSNDKHLRCSAELLGPSPTSYNIPSTLKIQERPDHVQCFGTSSNRFQSPANAAGPSPGSYGKPVSDFERRAMEARKMKMRQVRAVAAEERVCA